MYPKLLKIGISTFQYILETDPEILHKAIHLHGRFHPKISMIQTHLSSYS